MTSIPYLLPIEETLKTAWNKVKGAKGTIWVALIIWIVIMIGLGILDQLLLSTAPKIEPLFSFVSSIINFLLDMGLVYIGIRRAQDLPISYELIFNTFNGRLALRIIGVYILQFLSCLIPILIVIAGASLLPAMGLAAFPSALSFVLICIGVLALIFITVRLSLSVGFVLDKGIGPIDAIKLSFHATHSNFWRIVFIFFLQSLILIVCAIPLGIGLIWGIPFAMINYGVVYKNLSTNNLTN